MQYRVILPAHLAAGQKLKAVYLLHGGGGGFRDWSNYSDVGQYAKAGLLLVMPEGGYSYYTNAVDPAQDRFMLCGSPGMLHDTRTLLDARGFVVSPHIGEPGDYVIERAFVEK